MPKATRRAIKGALGNFLGTYVSRYTEYDGYWLFGFLVEDLGELRFDLVPPTPCESASPIGAAMVFATTRFADQMSKAGVNAAWLGQAWLTIRRLPGPADSQFNGRPAAGYSLSFSVVALTDHGRRYERERVVFVAPHNAAVEHRSARADQ